MQRLAFLLIFTILSASCAFAEVIVTNGTEQYVVSGTSPKSILANLRSSTPLKRAGGKTYQANAATGIRYTFKWKERDGQCTVTDFTVRVHINYLYPELAHSVNAKTRAWWNELLDQLRIHEEIHGQISIKAAHELDDALGHFQSEDCLNFKSIVKNRANRLIDELWQRQRDYDELTEHGLHQARNQGRYP